MPAFSQKRWTLSRDGRPKDGNMESFVAAPRKKVECVVPELSRFFGIIIRMFWEVGAPHHAPHFHAYYQDEVAVYGINPIELIEGSLPRRQRRLVEAWAELHQPELVDDW